MQFRKENRRAILMLMDSGGLRGGEVIKLRDDAYAGEHNRLRLGIPLLLKGDHPGALPPGVGGRDRWGRGLRVLEGFSR
jgi:hypothetical protein